MRRYLLADLGAQALGLMPRNGYRPPSQSGGRYGVYDENRKLRHPRFEVLLPVVSLAVAVALSRWGRGTAWPFLVAIGFNVVLMARGVIKLVISRRRLNESLAAYEMLRRKAAGLPAPPPPRDPWG